MVKLSSGIELNPNKLTSEDREAIVKALEETKSGVWKPKQGQRYYTIDSFNNISYEPWGVVDERGDGTDRAAFEIGNVFKTASEAERHLTYLKALQVLRGDTKGYEYENKHSETYWTIGVFEDNLEPDYYGEVLDVIKFKTKEDAQSSLDAHRDSWAVVLGVE